MWPRSAEFARFFDGWELVDPGIAWLSEWHPTSAVATHPTLARTVIPAFWSGYSKPKATGS